MQCLRDFTLTIPHHDRDSLGQDSQNSQHFPVPKDTVTVAMSELTGPTAFLNHLVSRLPAPSLQGVSFVLHTGFPLPYLSRVIDEVREEFRSVSVTSDMGILQLLLSTHLGEIDHSKSSESSIWLKVNCSLQPIKSKILPRRRSLP